MCPGKKVEAISSMARALEKKYDWIKAADLYGQALGVVGKKDFWKRGQIQESIGFCFYRAAMQGRSQEEFRKRMQHAIGAYERALGFYEKLTDKQKVAKILHCRAVAKYFGYWLASNPSGKRELLDECLELEGKALEAFLESGDMLEYGRTYNELSLVFSYRVSLEWDKQTLKSIVERGIEWGEKALAVLSELDSYELARTYITLAICLGSFAYYFIAEPEQLEKNRLKIVKYLSKAVDLSEKVGDAFLLGLSHLWLGRNTLGEESIEHHKKALEYSRETRDNMLIGDNLHFLAGWTYWKAVAMEDPAKRKELAEKAMQFYEKGWHHHSLISYMNPYGGIISPPAGHAEHYLHLALWETNSKKRLEFLERSEKSGMEALKLAEDSEMPLAVYTVLHVASKTLETRARMEPEPTEKRRLLQKALKYRGKNIEIMERFGPINYWNQGVMQNYVAGIKAKLADLQSDLNSKRILLEEVAFNKEKCLELCNKMMPYYERVGNITYFAALHGYQDTYSTLLMRLYDLTNKPEHIRKAVEISQKAIESADKLDMISLIAESYWKVAKAQDILGEHMKAAKNFEHASESYMKAAKKIPKLKNFYQDHASYMQAWNEIEKAKHHHAEKQYGEAKQHYEKAARLHKLTERWNYLSLNYLAWARLEEAEDLSRGEQTQEARNLFQQAAKLFEEAKKSIKTKLERIEASDEKELASELVKASDIRREYCFGRIALEEAKIFDRQGDHIASSKKYGLAVEIFQKIAEAESEQSRKELQPIIYLCQAWQKMMMAEAKASSTMYGEAAELFKQAKEHTLDQPTSLLALAHSSFCKALEAGTEFEITRDMAMYSTAKKHMEAAATYYLKAGFKNASEYARATHRLFDAYMYINKAETETEPRKKAQYYQITEKLLQASAGSYMKAKHPEKSEEIRALLESVKEEQQLAISLTEMLHAPAIASTTTSFFTPTPTHEKAVGLEKFEHANIQAHLTTSEEVTVGEELEVRLDLVNVAKNFGLLVRVEELVSPSFKVTVFPSQYNVENGSINMNGRKLESLKIESIRLRLLATETGVINLCPKVIYIDEVGEFRTCRPEPVSVTVHPKLAFEFETQAAQNVFDFLIRSFVEDYMRRKISLEKSGWRTLTEIIKHGKVSKSSVYGVGGHRGAAISELERRGIVETRIFPGERGRGGRILKMRISYEKETIKRHIDQRVMKNKESCFEHIVTDRVVKLVFIHFSAFI